MGAFTQHRYFLRFLGIVLPGEVRNWYVRLAFNLWFGYLALCLPVLTACFFLGVTNLHSVYSATAITYSISGVISSACASVKLYLLRHHRRDIKELVDVLFDVEADTGLGRFTTALIYLYQGLALGFRVISLSEVLAKRKLTILMPFWTPFTRQNPGVALATLIFYQGSAIIKTICNFFTDAVFLNISNQLCHRLFILKNTFKLIGLPPEEKRELLKGKYILKIPENVINDDEMILKLCIKEHIFLLKTVGKFSKILNRIFLPQSFNAFASICTALFLVSQADNMIGEAFKVTPWTTLIFLQLFVSCFAGELIKQKFHDIFVTSYSNNWYNCPEKVRSSLLVVQTYTSKHKSLRGAYVIELSLHTYETAVREVFSTFTVMYQLFNTK
nr:olfactory receptor 78 [Tropidothorax elegans]